MEPMQKDHTPQPAADFPAGLSAPAQRALAGAGFTRLDQLAGASEAEILALHGMGPKAMDLLRRALDENGLSFAAPRAPD